MSTTPPTTTTPPAAPWLPAAVTAAADALREHARRGGGDLEAMTVVDLAELGGALEDLLTRLAGCTHRVAPQVAELPDHHELREDTGTVDATARCLQAADHLTQVAAHLAAAQAAAHLAAAQAAAQEFHTAIAHLAPHDVD